MDITTQVAGHRNVLINKGNICFVAVMCAVGLWASVPSSNVHGAELTADEEWGCQVLLCLANPNGPKAVSECLPPINKLYSCFYRIHNPCAFPTCPMAGEGNYAQPLTDSYDPCSLQGMEDAPAGWIMEGDLTDSAKFTRKGSRYYLKSGSAVYNYAGKANGINPVNKACVKDPQGTVQESYQCSIEGSDSGSNWQTCYRTVQVFGEVSWQQAQSSHAVDVYVEGQLWTRVHW